MVSRNKLLTYLGIGAVIVVGGYFVFKQVQSSAAKKGALGALSGIGQRSMQAIGLDAGSLPFIGKKEAIADTRLASQASPVAPHSPTVRTLQAPMPMQAKQAVTSTVGTGRTTRQIKPFSYGSAAAGRGIVTPPLSARPAAISRAKAKTAPIPRLARRSVRTGSRAVRAAAMPISRGSSRSMYGSRF